jgi:signal transduction histidine kinase
VGLSQALLDYCQRIARQTGLKINYRGSDASSLPEYIQTSLYRVAQEALTNVVKHAAAAQVEVGLMVDAEQVCLTIQDDGRGFPPAQSSAVDGGSPENPLPGIGLLGIRDRIEAIGGTLRIDSQPGTGATLTASVPLEEAA